jgi:hypothetical protein
MIQFFSCALQQIAVYQAAHPHQTAFIAVIGRDDQGILVLEVQPHNVRVANDIWGTWRHRIPHFVVAVALINEYTSGGTPQADNGDGNGDDTAGLHGGVVAAINFPEVVRRWTRRVVA